MWNRSFTIASSILFVLTVIGVFAVKPTSKQDGNLPRVEPLELYQGTTSTEVDTYDVEYIVENDLGWNEITVTLHTKGNSGKVDEIAIIATDEFGDNHWDSITFTRKHRTFSDAQPIKVVRTKDGWKTESGNDVDLPLLGKIYIALKELNCVKHDWLYTQSYRRIQVNR